MGTGLKTACKLSRRVICYLLAVAALAFATVPGPMHCLIKPHANHHRPSRRSLIEFGAMAVSKSVGMSATAVKAKSLLAQGQAIFSAIELKVSPRLRLVGWITNSVWNLQPVHLRLQSLRASRGPP